MSARKRVLIIGLDGFTWRLGRGFMAEGVMPYLAALVEQGCHGHLRSVIPFETSPAWSSFQTGCLPGKTGVFAFHTYDRKRNKIRLNSFADIAVPTLWELADRAGRKVVSLNMPVTSPPPKVNGVIIPGFACPKLSAETVQPAQAYFKYIKPHKDYLIVNSDYQDTVREYAEQSIATERVRSEVALELMKDIDWDIFCVQIQSSDLMQHRVWRVLDPAAGIESRRERQEALRFYRFCDQTVSRIIEAAGPDVLTLIVSDHGFCSAQYSVAVNVWLRQHGYLQLLPQQPKSKWTVFKDNLKQRSPGVLFLTRLYGNILNVSKPKRRGPSPVFGIIDLAHMRRTIDLEKTKALCLGGMASLLYINAAPPRRAELANQIAAELLRDLGPESAIPAIARISSGAEAYGSERVVDSLPDLVLEYREGFESRRNPTGDTVLASRQPNGTHSREGIFVAHGPGVRSGNKLDADIVDIMPTVLAYLGVPIPKYVDGKVLDAAFAEPFKVSREDITHAPSKPVEYSDAEQAKVEKQLADLGYL